MVFQAKFIMAYSHWNEAVNKDSKGLKNRLLEPILWALKSLTWQFLAFLIGLFEGSVKIYDGIFLKDRVLVTKAAVEPELLDLRVEAHSRINEGFELVKNWLSKFLPEKN